MSAYDSDPRVSVHHAYSFDVQADDLYLVVAREHDADFWVTPALDAAVFRDASRVEADALSELLTRGPYPSADEAIRSLIGEPR